MSTDQIAEIRLRAATDFPFYARNCLSIVTKGAGSQRLVLNSAQTLIHEALERQLAETGKIRAVILKGRQQGASTYVEARFFWRITHGVGRRGFVMTDKGDTTDAVFAMVRKFYDDCPDVVRPSIDSNTSKSLSFGRIDGGYTVGTAGGRATAGRGKTFQYFHGSECAYWDNEEEIVTGALQAIPPIDGTEVILESTANGAKGLFHRYCMDAQAGESDYILIFVPWFLQTEYARPMDAKVRLTEGDLAYQADHGLTDEQMAWRYHKVKELGSVARFRREYPATVAEAFQADVTGALWSRDELEKCRVSQARMPPVTRTVIGLDPATTSKKKSDETGIVVVQQAENGHAYVVEDASGKYTTTEWVRKVLELNRKYDADCIVAETNQGGDLVIESIRSVDPNANVRGNHVRESKRVRHEHVHASYQRGVVHHLGSFDKLEDSMTSWIPGLTKVSPDRLDALCLAVGELVFEEIDPWEFWIAPPLS